MFPRTLKTALILTTLCLTPAAYALIDELVADAPHAAMTLDDLCGRRTETTVTVDGMSSLEEMITDGLLLPGQRSPGRRLPLDLLRGGRRGEADDHPDRRPPLRARRQPVRFGHRTGGRSLAAPSSLRSDTRRS